MNGRHSVGAVRANNGEVRHADLFRGALFNQTYAADAGVVTGKARAHDVKEAAVDFVNDFELAGQQGFEPG